MVPVEEILDEEICSTVLPEVWMGGVEVHTGVLKAAQDVLEHVLTDASSKIMMEIKRI